MGSCERPQEECRRTRRDPQLDYAAHWLPLPPALFPRDGGSEKPNTTQKTAAMP
ncbi:MAG: hypothetical protein ABI234_06205 [Ktedonobacteraceae bacterium]